MIRSWLQNDVCPRSTQSSRRRPHGTLGFKSFRPEVEPLEDRRLLNAGMLDPTFGTRGRVLSELAASNSTSAALQEVTSKIVVLTTVDYNFAVSRFNEDGSIDRSFGTDGTTTVDFFGRKDEARALAIQKDGSIVAVGVSMIGGNGNYDRAAACRLTADGTLDADFGVDGRAIVNWFDVPYNGTDGQSVALQDDGKVLIGGSSFNHSESGIYRLNANGSLDTAFGQSGYARQGISGGGYWRMTSVVFMSDGVIVGCTSVNTTGPNFYNSWLGAWDANGHLLTPYGYAENYISQSLVGGWFAGGKLGIQPREDGTESLLVSGSIWTGTSWDFGMVRWLGNGQFDQTFGNNGSLRTDFANGSNDRAGDFFLQPNGKIIVAGMSAATGSDEFNFAATRYSANGVLDTSFGIHGFVTTDFRRRIDQGESIVYQPWNNKFLIAGNSITSNEDYGNIAMARYLLVESPEAGYDLSVVDALINADSGGKSASVTEQEWLQTLDEFFADTRESK